MAREGRRIHIGTSGWNYPHWKGPFYPEGIADRELFAFYAQRFGSVEINNTFYHLPSEQTVLHWRQQAPPGFCFAVKASRYITHMKKLKDPDRSLPPFLDRVRLLGDCLGPVLFQLPPRWRVNVDRLAEFCDALPEDLLCTFEFRDPSWFAPEVYDLLAAHNAAFCIYDLDGRLSPREVTADFVYVRLHGPDGPYQGQYDTETLAGWAGAFSAWVAQGREIYCFFDNDEAGYAARDAIRLLEMLAG